MTQRSDLYSEADIAYGIAALATTAADHEDVWIGAAMPDVVIAVLDAVAPAIATRALREAADSARQEPCATVTHGYVARWLDERADGIEVGR